MKQITLEELQQDRDKAIAQYQQRQKELLMLEGVVAYLNANIDRLEKEGEGEEQGKGEEL